MGLRDIDIQRNYDSADNDVVNDFYIPALSQSIEYDRIAGFFTSSSLAISLRGVVNIIEHGGRIRMLASPRFSADDAIAMNAAISDPEPFLSDWIYKNVLDNDNASFSDYRKLMSHLIAKGILQIKVVLVKMNGRYLTGEEIDNISMFHQKVGILKDADGNKVSFSGSINESFVAWNDNIEEFKTFKSWEPGQAEYCESDEKKFSDYWNNMKERAETIDIPNAVRNRFIEITKEEDFEDVKKRIRSRESRHTKERELFETLFEYQREAVKQWESNNFRLLFNMATGTGKTRTALSCIERMLKKERLLVIIATPQSMLSKQWLDEVENLKLDFGPTLVCDGSNAYKTKLDAIISKLNLGVYNKATLFTTHSTACKSHFLNKTIEDLKHSKTKVLFVGDEVHGLGSEIQQKGLSDVYEYRIGLSATPSRWYDDEGSLLLANYFGGQSFEFDISKAIRTVNPITGKTFLTPYYYYPRTVYLTEGEDEEYEAKTQRLSKLHGDDEEIKKRRERLLQERADILKGADDKLTELEDLIIELKGKGRIENTIVFTSPKHLVDTLEILDRQGVLAAPLTEAQKNTPLEKYNGLSERQNILKEFSKRSIQVIVAIKCMDEGIDIPSADTAILMASTTNPREYIQRIGRVIRRYEGKRSAVIYDFVTKSHNKNIDKTIQSNELRRARYIAELANNSVDAIIKMYD